MGAIRKQTLEMRQVTEQWRVWPSTPQKNVSGVRMILFALEHVSEFSFSRVRVTARIPAAVSLGTSIGAACEVGGARWSVAM